MVDHLKQTGSMPSSGMELGTLRGNLGEVREAQEHLTFIMKKVDSSTSPINRVDIQASHTKILVVIIEAYHNPQQN